MIRCRKAVLLLPICSVLSIEACKDTTAVEIPALSRIRIFNNVFQGATPSSAVAISVDFLVDSSTASPGVAGLSNGSYAAGDASGAGVAASSSAAAMFSAAGYRDVPVAIHSFQSRKAGQSGPLSAFFRNVNGTEFLPKQYLTPLPYTCVLAGLIPPDGTPWTSSPVAFCMVSSPDDPFTPPLDTLSGHTGLTARMRFINAATFASATGIGASLTFTLTPATAAVSPANITTTAAFRAASTFVNPPAGDYTLSISSTAGTLFTSPITFAKGDVRTILVYSTGFNANPVTGANTRIVNTLDNKF